MLLEPILKPRVWGGRELARFSKILPPDEPIGESWELADLPDTIADGRSRVANGPLAGRRLREAIGEQRQAIMGVGRLSDEGGFPLLIKYLDARHNLSVQVHPTAAYVADHPEAHLKSEAWVVIDAQPGAVIYKGVKPHVTAEHFAAHIEADEVVDDLIAVPVRPGDCHYLPSGTCHALGAGVLVAEVQTPSDTTFRVYDWGRTGRELHVAQALHCIQFGATTQTEQPAQPIEAQGFRTTPLTETEYFVIERVEALETAELPVVTDDMPVVWMVVAGAGRLRGGGEDIALAPGVTALMPAALTDGVAMLEKGCALLEITLPSPMKGMIAS
jgi:mannose-6-phosphate isomerase